MTDKSEHIKKESEELINELEKIYKRAGWRDVKQLVIYES